MFPESAIPLKSVKRLIFRRELIKTPSTRVPVGSKTNVYDPEW